MSFYDISVKNLRGDIIDFKKFKDKAVLVVNVASECEFTSQYLDLEKVYKEYKPKGLEVIAFPCNQFGCQESGTNEDIAQVCERFGVTFEIFDKVKVNGPDSSPVYNFLKTQIAGDIKWNFYKYLVDRNGVVIERYESVVKPTDERFLDAIKVAVKA